MERGREKGRWMGAGRQQEQRWSEAASRGIDGWDRSGATGRAKRTSCQGSSEDGGATSRASLIKGKKRVRFAEFIWFVLSMFSGKMGPFGDLAGGATGQPYEAVPQWATLGGRPALPETAGDAQNGNISP